VHPEPSNERTNGYLAAIAFLIRSGVISSSYSRPLVAAKISIAAPLAMIGGSLPGDDYNSRCNPHHNCQPLQRFEIAPDTRGCASIAASGAASTA
jgi:hypothetical protein